MFPAKIVFVFMLIFGADGSMRVKIAPVPGATVEQCQVAADELAKREINESAGKVLDAQAICHEFSPRNSA